MENYIKKPKWLYPQAVKCVEGFKLTYCVSFYFLSGEKNMKIRNVKVKKSCVITFTCIYIIYVYIYLY